jgi:hypothetical protein
MSFRSWLFAESILVQWQRDQAALVPSEGPRYEFNYQTENSWSRFWVGCYQAKRPGYVSISSRPTHAAIIKHSPLERENSVDYGFLKNLIQLLQKSGMKPVPYKEIGTSFDVLFNKINFEPEHKPETGWQTGESLPDQELGSPNMQKLSPGISASKESGSWAYFVESYDSAQYYANKFVELLEQAAAPLIKNDFIDFYEVVDRHTNKHVKVVYSQKGQQESDDWKTKDKKAASQIKYLADTLLGSAPTFKTILIRIVGTEDLKGGGKGWFGYDAQPQNYNLPIEELHALNKRSFSEDIVIKIFLDTIQSGDKTRFQQLEQLAKWAEQKKQASVGQKYPPYWIGGGAEKLSWFWEKNSILKDCIEEPIMHISTIFDVMKYAEILQQLEPEELDYWKQQVKNAIEEELPHAEHLRPNEISYLNQLAGPLNLHPSLLHSLEQADQKHKDEKAERDKLAQESALKRSFLMPVDSYVYMMIKDGKWESIPENFLHYAGQENYEVNIGELALDIIGEEDTYYDAEERARAEAEENLEQRPSESYGEDEKEVEGDIDYDWDDFIDSQGIEEIDEDTPEEEAVRIIKNDYWDVFIKWKIEKLKEKEDEESWKYELDDNDSEYGQRISHFQEEIAEEMAWEQGLIILQTDIGKVDIQIGKKHWQTFKPILKRTIELNIHTKDEEDEPYWKASTKISIDYIPKGGFVKDAYTLLQELGR